MPSKSALSVCRTPEPVQLLVGKVGTVRFDRANKVMHAQQRRQEPQGRSQAGHHGSLVPVTGQRHAR
jgi:hypothetical protein